MLSKNISLNFESLPQTEKVLLARIDQLIKESEEKEKTIKNISDILTLVYRHGMNNDNLRKVKQIINLIADSDSVINGIPLEEAYEEFADEAPTDYSVEQIQEFVEKIKGIIKDTDYELTSVSLPYKLLEEFIVENQDYQYINGKLQIDRPVTPAERQSLISIAQNEDLKYKILKFCHKSQLLFQIYKELSWALKDFFNSKYVELISYNGNVLKYEYITSPERLLELTYSMTGVGALLGVEIPLFKGMIIKDKLIKHLSIDEASLQEIMQPWVVNWEQDQPEFIGEKKDFSRYILEIYRGENQFNLDKSDLKIFDHYVFEKSYFTSMVEQGRDRELISYEQRFHSLQDFVSPETEKGRRLRRKVTRLIMGMFNYKYIYQVPLIIGDRFHGYFSFLQQKRFSPEVRTHIYLISNSIAQALQEKLKAEQIHLSPIGIVRIKPIISNNGKIDDFEINEANDAFNEMFEVDEGKVAEHESLLQRIDHFSNGFEKLSEVYFSGISRTFDITFYDRGKTYRFVAEKSYSGDLILNVTDATREIELRTKDGLTGLLNQNSFWEALNQKVAEADRYNDRKFALFFIDLNYLKRINDSFGHLAGDEAIKLTADILKNTFRRSDIITRQGGDEFLVIVDNVSDRMTAEKLIKKALRQISSSTFEYEGKQVPISLSIGVSFYNRYDNPDAIFRRSDAAMYRAKIISHETGVSQFNIDEQ